MCRSHSRPPVGPLVLAVLLASGTTGCSLLFSHGPPSNHAQMDYFTCTESKTAPILDAVGAGLNAVYAVGIASDPDDYEFATGMSSGAGIALSLGQAALYVASASVGFNRSRQCRAAMAQLAERQAQRRAAASRTTPWGLPPPAGTVAIPRLVMLDPGADTLTVGGQVQLRATAWDSAGIVIPGATFAWSSLNEVVASVSPDGLVSAVAPGSALIVAELAGIVGAASILVLPRD